MIGLTGAKRAGKDAVADVLVAEHGYVKLGFADAVKKVLRLIDPILDFEDRDSSCGDPDCCGGYYPDIQPVRLSQAMREYPDEDDLKASEYGEEYVRLLQGLGEGVRAVDDGFWVREVARKLRQLDEAGATGAVVSGVRHPNEAGMLTTGHWPDVALWHVVRPGKENNDGHITEQFHGSLGETVELINDGTKLQLASKIEGFV